MAQEIELFDLPSRKPCAAWSLNPWKTRLVLNYKNIPYKTTWIEYPDIAPTLKGFGLPPNAEGRPYTVPAVKLPDGRYIMDSIKIAHELEKLYPEPSLHLDSPVLKQVMELLPSCIGPLTGFIMPKVPRNLLNPSSVEYFERTRAEGFGMPLAQLEKEKGGENVFGEADPGFKKVGQLLRQNGGPFFQGTTVSYADFVVMGGLDFFRRVDNGLFERVIAMDPSLKELYEAGKEWLARNDH